MYVYIHIYIYVCMYVCMYVCIYIYVYDHLQTGSPWVPLFHSGLFFAMNNLNFWYLNLNSGGSFAELFSFCLCTYVSSLWTRLKLNHHWCLQEGPCQWVQLKCAPRLPSFSQFLSLGSKNLPRAEWRWAQITARCDTSHIFGILERPESQTWHLSHLPPLQLFPATPSWLHFRSKVMPDVWFVLHSVPYDVTSIAFSWGQPVTKPNPTLNKHE